MTECNQCGNCCDPVYIGGDQMKVIDEWDRYTAAGGEVEAGGDIGFLRAHWRLLDRRPDGSASFACSFFDPASRTCQAYDLRPKVCSGYPWYDREPVDDGRLNPACSFNEDIRPSLPIVEIT